MQLGFIGYVLLPRLFKGFFVHGEVGRRSDTADFFDGMAWYPREKSMAREILWTKGWTALSFDIECRRNDLEAHTRTRLTRYLRYKMCKSLSGQSDGICNPFISSAVRLNVFVGSLQCIKPHGLIRQPVTFFLGQS